MINPRSLVPESIMPGYPWLASRKIDAADVLARMKTLKLVGVPYDDDMIKNAEKDLAAQANPGTAGCARDMLKRYLKAKVVKLDAGRRAADGTRGADRLSASPGAARRLRDVRCLRSQPALRGARHDIRNAVATFSQVASLLIFVALFIVMVGYALWPRNKEKFGGSTAPRIGARRRSARIARGRK